MYFIQVNRGHFHLFEPKRAYTKKVLHNPHDLFVFKAVSPYTSLNFTRSAPV